MQPLSKDQILRGFNRGEERARGSVYDLYHDALLVMVRKITRDSSSAEDLVNDSFGVLFEQTRDFNSLKELRNFLFQTAKNLSINHLVDVGKSDQVRDNLREQARYTDENFDADMCYSETRSLLYKSIENLPDKLKTVFRLRYFEGLQNEEVAQQLSIAEKTAYNRYYEARQKLKWDLEKVQRFTLYLLNLFI